MANKAHQDTEDFIKNLHKSRKSVAGEANSYGLDPEIIKKRSPLASPRDFIPKYPPSIVYQS